MNIVVHGYYGFGNLGDDLLCKVILEHFHVAFPEANLFVLSYARDPSYIHDLVEFPIQTIDQLQETDVFCLGGGGVFFDFKQGSSGLINTAIRLIGLKAFAGAAKLLGKSYRSRITCGIGIGVGTFTVDSDKFRTKSLQLGEMKRLYVRDNVSIDNLSALGYSGHVEVSSDLAFLRNYWLKPASRDKANQVSRVGFVLRDWTKNNSDYLENVASWIYDLRKEGIGCDIISFDQQHDKTIVEWSRSNQFELISWDPFKKRISDFCESLSGYDLIITSRAHGAIMAGCLGIPCMIIHLEDKLLQISQMFPTSMQLVNTDETVGELRSLMKSYITNFDNSRLASEVENNENKIQKSIQELTSFIKTA